MNNKFAVGGSYTLKNTGVSELSFPTYEIHLSLLGGASKSKSKSKTSHALPTYSFVHTELPKKTRTEVIHDNYVAAIAKADKAFAAKNYEEARLDYFEAQKYKPSENYPKTKIDEIGKIIAYDTDIKKANNELSSKSYEQSLADYEAANKLFPNEKYPIEKIAEIKALMAKESEAEELERRYREAITKADASFNTKDYPTAKNQYTNAASLKPKEQYPKDKLKEIERLLAVTVVTKSEIKTPQEPVKEVVKEPVKELPKEPVERHETVKRGSHLHELETGNYVIVGVFGSVDNAKSMARRLVDTGFSANYGFLTEKNLWYVHIFAGDDINGARTERDKYRKQPLFRNAWLLTIQN